MFFEQVYSLGARLLNNLEL